MKPLTLAEAKDKIARDNGCEDWNHLQVSAQDDLEYEKIYDEAALLHSLSCQEALREKIASEAKMVFHGGGSKINTQLNYFQSGADNLQPDREAIRSAPLITE